MIILILKACAFILLIAASIAIIGSVRARLAVWNSPVERALRNERKRDPMQGVHGDWPRIPDSGRGMQ